MKLEDSADWLFALIRIAGTQFPVASALVQLQAELDSKALAQRIEKLEDPISHLHEDVPAVSRLLYGALKAQNSAMLSFEREFYSRYQRPLAMLESQRYIRGEHGIGHPYIGGIVLCDPTFIMYLCALAEAKEKMSSLVSTVDSCKPGQRLDGKKIALDLDLPEPVVKAVLSIYESKGLGLLSKEIGAIHYIGRA
jgi:hypothetical protein